jgi:hypothetical protein
MVRPVNKVIPSWNFLFPNFRKRCILKPQINNVDLFEQKRAFDGLRFTKSRKSIKNNVKSFNLKEGL